jgi:isoleucyl-tRNA synthetase
MYKSVSPKVDFPAMEEAVLAFWEAHGIFKKSLENRRGAPAYIMYDGPPFATGLPHYGHLVQSALKDSFPRYKTMKGFYVERRFGWDCHGLPVENETEKELGLSGKSEIERYGIAEFNEKCRSIVLRYTNEWRQYITRLGRWVDFENDYKTMDPDYMESIWAVFKALWEKDLIKEGHYILPYCPRCGTILSNHELNMGGYKTITEQSASVRFKSKAEENTYFVAWTTTPWTLPSNLALAVGENIAYVRVKDKEDGAVYILSKNRAGHYFKNAERYSIIWEGSGRELINIEYEPLFGYFSYLENDGAFRVRLGHHVTDSDGTGIVHIANGFGEDDYLVLKETGLPVIAPVDGEGKFTDEVPDYQGRFVKECDRDIINRLKDEGRLVLRESYTHSYPHCWRCESPLIYRAIGSWFVSVPKIKEQMLAANAQISWIPEHIKEGRFGKWLENARDWAISRNRFWGNPIPVWQCESCDKKIAVGSRAELKELSGIEPHDLHKHFIDDITIKCVCGGTMRRIPDVFDCWFESGSMPYAQLHYPFEHKESFDGKAFPADFIAEGIDQTRGWFYTLTVIAAALKNKPAFKMAITTGLVLSQDGTKMSKSKRNYTDPLEVVRTYGADAVRIYLQASPLTRGEDLKFSDEGVKDILKSTIIPLWNAYSFFVTYANIDGVMVTGQRNEAVHPLDKWVLSALRRLIFEVENAMESGFIQKALGVLTKFIDDLNNWYIRRSRRRFWKSSNDSDKMQAYDTLHHVLLTLSKIAAPFMPFISEEIYSNLKCAGEPESVHLCSWPYHENELRDHELENKMALTMQAVIMGRGLRSMYNLKNRLPLQTIFLVSRNSHERAVLKEMQAIVAEELNVKKVEIKENEEELVEYSAKANFKVLGKKLGSDMKKAAEVIEKLTQPQISGLLEGATLLIHFDGTLNKSINITESDIIIQRKEKANLKALNEASLTVALDTEITDELRKEGTARDLIRAVQNLRKERNFEISDRIKLYISGSNAAESALQDFTDLIKGETLAVEALWQPRDTADKIDTGEETFFIDIEKV